MSKNLIYFLLILGVLHLVGQPKAFAYSNNFKKEFVLIAHAGSVNEENASVAEVVSYELNHPDLIIDNFFIIENSENEVSTSKNDTTATSRNKLKPFHQKHFILGSCKDLQSYIFKYNKLCLHKSSTRLHVKLQVFII